MAEVHGLWRNRQFLLLSAAQLCSNLGDWLFSLALFVLIGLRWHGTPLEVGFAIVCNVLPVMLLGPIAGALADRAPRKALMLLSNVLCALLLPRSLGPMRFGRSTRCSPCSG
ncbi:MAG: MFS transporter [Thermaerobacter sp.]|nr:MFS transporter [Thermaerobacter sp.]